TMALILLVLSGHPESMLHVVALGVAYGIFKIVGTRGERLPQTIVAGLAAAAVTLAVCAIFLLPFLDAMVQSEEYIHRATGREHHEERAPWTRVAHEASVSILPLLEGRPGIAARRHDPAVQHHWVGSAYAGSLLFPLAFLAIAAGHRSDRWFFVAAGVIGFLAGVSAPGAVDVLARLPLFSIAVNVRLIGFAALSLSVLAAFGVDMLAPRRRLAGVLFGSTGVVLLITLFALAPNAMNEGLPLEWVRVEAFRAVAPILLGAPALLVSGPQRLPAAMLALLLLQRGGETAGTRPATPGAAFYPPFPGLALLKNPEPFRVVGEGDILVPNTATHYRLEDVRGFEALTLARLHETYRLWCIKQPVWSNRVDDLTKPFLSMMNVRFALAKPRKVPPAGWVRLGAFGDYDVLENTRVLPRAFVPQIVHTGRRDTVLEMLLLNDFSRQAWIAEGAKATVANGPGSVRAARSGTGLRLRATMVHPGWVVVSNAAWKGWRARDANGRDLPLTTANHAFLGIHVPQGEHDIRLEYRPRSFELGAAISGVAALLLLSAGFIGAIRKRRASST
ncbi:MAG TPA: YfhO family protein, partial [Thermoanaerobaculia bacterium]|nr:YfhO family protein [Thermoanaerobaculia bacterium]